MKRKNAGISTVEIVVAAVILVAIIVGLLVVVKLSKGTKGTNEDQEKATQIVNTLLAQMEENIRSADLDINYDADNYIRLVGKNKCQIYYFDSSADKVYLLEKNSSEFGSDDDAIRAAVKDLKPDVSEMTEVAANVKTFVIELENQDKPEGTATTTVRADVGEKSWRDTKPTPLNNSLLNYFANQAGHELELPTNTPTPTPEATSTPTPKPDQPTPTPSKPEDTPTPTPTEAPKEKMTKNVVQNPTTNVGTVIVNQQLNYKNKDGIMIVYVRRNEDETEYMKGSTIGGLCFDSGAIADGYEFVLDRDPEPNEVLEFKFVFDDLLEFVQGNNIKKIMAKVIDGSGYSLQGVDIEYWK